MSVHVVFLDEDHNVVPAGKATLVVETEKNEAGEVVSETWGRVVSSRQATAPGVSTLTTSGVALLAISSISMLLGAPGWIGAILLVAGIALALTGLLRSTGQSRSGAARRVS